MNDETAAPLSNSQVEIADDGDEEEEEDGAEIDDNSSKVKQESSRKCAFFTIMNDISGCELFFCFTTPKNSAG